MTIFSKSASVLLSIVSEAFDSSIQARLESKARDLRVLTGPETRGIRSFEIGQTLPPEPAPLPDDVLAGLDMGKPPAPAVCPVCEKQLPPETHVIPTPDGNMLACKGCKL